MSSSWGAIGQIKEQQSVIPVKDSSKLYSAKLDLFGNKFSFPVEETMTGLELRVSIAKSRGIIPVDSQPAKIVIDSIEEDAVDEDAVVVDDTSTVKTLSDVLEEGIRIFQTNPRSKNVAIGNQDKVDFSNLNGGSIIVLFLRNVFIPKEEQTKLVGGHLLGHELDQLKGWSERFLAQQASK